MAGAKTGSPPFSKGLDLKYHMLCYHEGIRAAEAARGFHCYLKKRYIQLKKKYIQQRTKGHCVMGAFDTKMHTPARIPANDAERVAFLRSLNILDSKSDPAFDCIAEAARTITHSPIALVSLVDAERQWFKSRIGLDVSETHRDLAFCSHVVAQSGGEMFVVNDAMQDERFKNSELVLGEPRIRFYAGVPLVLKARDGSQHKIGTLCVIDRTPRQLQDHHRVVLEALARQVVSQICASSGSKARPTRPPPPDPCAQWSGNNNHWPACPRAYVVHVDGGGACCPLTPAQAEGMWRGFLRQHGAPAGAGGAGGTKRGATEMAGGYEADDSDGGLAGPGRGLRARGRAAAGR